MAYVNVDGRTDLKKDEAQRTVCASVDEYQKFKAKKVQKQTIDTLLQKYETLNKRVEELEEKLRSLGG